MALSFDDGYLEMHDFVAPELQRRSMGATFFVLPEFASRPRNLAPEMRWTDGCPYLSRSMIRELADQGFELGAHGLRHHVLTTVDDRTAKAEVIDSRIRLAELIGRDVCGFAYPCGAHAGRHAQMAVTAGYEWAVTVEPGVIDSARHPMLLPAHRDRR